MRHCERRIRGRGRASAPFGETLIALRLLIGSFAPLSTKEVAQRSTLDKVRVSRTTNRLVRQGLVTAERDASDRRKVELRLTPVGKAKYRGVATSLSTWDNAFVQALDPSSLTALVQMLQALDRRIDELEKRHGEAGR